MTARRARQIRRRCQRNSQSLNHFGVSELFLAPARDAEVILAARDLRLRCWLLGFTETPIGTAKRRESGPTTTRVAHSVGRRNGPQLTEGPLLFGIQRGPQLPVAVRLTGLDNTGQRMLVIDVEPSKLVHREPPMQVSHGAFKRLRILPAARRLRFHSLCQIRE